MRSPDEHGTAAFTKTITESDFNLFAGITGDLNPMQVDELHAVSAGFVGRIAHGAFVLGLMSAACTVYAQRAGITILSYGWDGVRFAEPVLIGDTITATYRPTSEPAEPVGGGWKRTALALAHNQRGDLVGLGRHIAYLLDKPLPQLDHRVFSNGHPHEHDR